MGRTTSSKTVVVVCSSIVVTSAVVVVSGAVSVVAASVVSSSKLISRSSKLSSKSSSSTSREAAVSFAGVSAAAATGVRDVASVRPARRVAINLFAPPATSSRSSMLSSISPL